jgi:hypothetical protein
MTGMVAPVGADGNGPAAMGERPVGPVCRFARGLRQMRVLFDMMGRSVKMPVDAADGFLGHERGFVAEN